MAALSDAPWARRARLAAVVIASFVLIVQVATVGARLAESHARLATQVAGSLVLFTVGALREAGSIDVMMGVMALGVLVGLGLGWEREARSDADSR